MHLQLNLHGIGAYLKQYTLNLGSLLFALRVNSRIRTYFSDYLLNAQYCMETEL